MITKIGVVIDEYNVSQLTDSICYLATNINNAKTFMDMVVFYDKIRIPKRLPSCALMPQYEMWSYDATILATSLYTADTLITCPIPTKKYFYIQNLEWIKGNLTYQQLHNIYMNPEIELITRSETHFNIVKRLWREPYCILPNFDIDIITEKLT